MFTRILSIALVALLALPMLLGTAPTDAKKKHKKRNKTITRTISFSSDIDVPVSGPADPYPAPITVTKRQLKKLRKVKIKDVNVTLHNITYPAPEDFDVLLVAPDGRNAIIMSDVGAAIAVSDVTLTLDDAAAQSLPDAGPLVSGTFKPTDVNNGSDFFSPPAPTPSGDSALSIFNGTNPKGQWRLFVHSNGGNGPGEVEAGWSLQITAKGKVKHKKRHRRH